MKLNFKDATKHFGIWFLGLSQMLRYLVVAILVHVVILLSLAMIKIAVELPTIIATFTGGPPPDKNFKEEPDDPFAAYREWSYNGPTLGGGGGTPGKGPGGIPTAAGTTPTEYKAAVLDSSPAEGNVAEVIGVDVGDSALAVARLQGGPGGMSAPTTGLGEGTVGTAGVRGPGGGGFGQRQGPQRAQNINKNGGTMATERAVLAALRWLKEHQRPDGGWDCGVSGIAGTGMATLAFLGHGETPDSSEFGATVNKALQFLVANINEQGIVRDGNMYAQGVVTLALSEAYGMTQSPAVKEPLQRAVAAIVQAQKVPKGNPAFNGGWRYSPGSGDADVSVSGWMIMALKSAKMAGMDVTEEAFENASKFLWNMHNGPGFGYQGNNHTPAMTAVGVLCQQFMGHGGDKRIFSGLEYLQQQKVSWDRPTLQRSLYAWYYITQAMFQGGGGSWIYWNREFRDTVVKNQAGDGHWDPPDNTDKAYGPVYSTTLCCLMLEVYYRYLPIYQEYERRQIK
jgi:hypothetical protein